jgi:Flp pilus assembly protein TadB
MISQRQQQLLLLLLLLLLAQPGDLPRPILSSSCLHVIANISERFICAFSTCLHFVVIVVVCVVVVLTSSQAHRLTGSQAHKLTSSQAHRLTGSQAHRLTSSQAHRLTGFTGSQAHRLTGSQAQRKSIVKLKKQQKHKEIQQIQQIQRKYKTINKTQGKHNNTKRTSFLATNFGMLFVFVKKVLYFCIVVLSLCFSVFANTNIKNTRKYTKNKKYKENAQTYNNTQ